MVSNWISLSQTRPTEGTYLVAPCQLPDNRQKRLEESSVYSNGTGLTARGLVPTYHLLHAANYPSRNISFWVGLNEGQATHSDKRGPSSNKTKASQRLHLLLALCLSPSVNTARILTGTTMQWIGKKPLLPKLWTWRKKIGAYCSRTKDSPQFCRSDMWRFIDFSEYIHLSFSLDQALRMVYNWIKYS